MVNALLPLLFLTVSSGVAGKQICVKSGEMVALQCTQSKVGQKAKVIWSTPRNSDIGSVNRTDLLITDGILVLLRASEDLQENYSCSTGVYKETYNLRVYTTLTGDCDKDVRIRRDCEEEEESACTLDCPTSNTPRNIPGFTGQNVTWQQDDKTQSEEYYFQIVKGTNKVNYTCVRSFLFNGHVYNMTFIIELVLRQKVPVNHEAIISPNSDENVYVDVGSPFEINCTAWIFATYDEIYWKTGESSIKQNKSLRVYTEDVIHEGAKQTVPLIFKEVSEADLSTVFTCRLESTSQNSISHNITLKQKGRPSYLALTVTAVVIPIVMVIFVLIYIKYKVHLTLFLRDYLGCHRKVSDGKSFDAFIMYYTSEQGTPGLSGDDRRTLQSVLEDQFGYSLCLFHRDVVPGKAVADAVLECVEQSRAVVLVPASPDFSSESSLLSVVHEALVERQTRLIFIKNISTNKTGAEPLSENLQMLTDLGHCVTWQGSLGQSSFFWKQLRYYLPPVQEPQKISLLPHTVFVED